MYLPGTVFDSKLKFDANTLTRLSNVGNKDSTYWGNSLISCLYYHPIQVHQSFIESLLTYSFVCWYNGLSVKDKNSLNGIVKVCSKIIGVRQRDLGSLWEKQVAQKARRIIAQPGHVLANAFSLMPSGQRYVAPPRKTNRYAICVSHMCGPRTHMFTNNNPDNE